MDVSNASLLDEASAAAEAVSMSVGVHNGKRTKFFMSQSIFPQTIDVVKTKCHAADIQLVLGKVEDFDWKNAKDYAGIMVQNPDNFGSFKDY